MRLVIPVILFGALALNGGVAANAETLQVAPDAPVIAHWGAALLLYSHIGLGAIGLIVGYVASVAKKGGKYHRISGNVFFVCMSICYLIGALVAPFLETGQRPNFVGGLLALYLLLSGVASAKRKRFEPGIYEYVGALTALFIAGMGAYFAYLGANSPSGTVDGAPPQAFVLFITMGLIAFAGEVHVIARKTVSYSIRISRHLWRLCSAFFIGAVSFFLAQTQVFPDWFNTSPAPALLALFPMIVLVVYGVWHRLPIKTKRMLS